MCDSGSLTFDCRFANLKSTLTHTHTHSVALNGQTSRMTRMLMTRMISGTTRKMIISVIHDQIENSDAESPVVADFLAEHF